MYKPESVWDNARNSLGFWDTNRLPNLGQTIRRGDNLQKMRTCRTMDFAVSADHIIKLKGSEKRDKFLDFAWELKEKYESDSDTNCNWCTWNNPQRISKENGRLGNKRTNRTHLEYSIIIIGQNTEKSPGDLKRLAVAQTPVRNYQLTLVWITLDWMIIIMIIIRLGVKVIHWKLCKRLIWY